MNSKGQSLVIFVILIPIFFVLVTGLWEIGNLSLTINKYENEIKDVIKYCLKNDEKDINKINILLNSNLNGKKDIEINDNVIKIHVIDEYKGLYKPILKNIDLTFIGYKENDKIIIEKE